MKKLLFSILASASLFTALPTSAQTATQQPIAPEASTASLTTPQTVIPQTTGIIVTFPAAVVVNVKDHRDEYPLTLPLAQAITDRQGNILVPQNTPVSIILRPTDQGAQIVAQSIVINGQIVPIQAASPTIPSTRVTRQSANQRAVESGSVLGRLGGSVFGFASGGDPDQFDRGAMLGSALGLANGLRSSDSDELVQIPQGSVYVLALQAPIALP